MWMLTLPIGKIENPRDVKYPEIVNYTNSNFRTVNGTIVLRTPVKGVSTENSKFPRTELREMADLKTRAFWNTSYGRHIVHFTTSVTRLPKTVPRVVIGQLYCEDDDLVQIRSLIRNKTTIIDVVYNKVVHVLDAKYKLGKTFSISMFVENNIVSVMYNTNASAVINLPNSFKDCYFKVGNYPQYHNATSSEISEVRLSRLNVTHVY
jgi:hypothetical protein